MARPDHLRRLRARRLRSSGTCRRRRRPCSRAATRCPRVRLSAILGVESVARERRHQVPVPPRTARCGRPTPPGPPPAHAPHRAASRPATPARRSPPPACLGRGRPALAAVLRVAAVVASSRVYVRIHHASDVVGRRGARRGARRRGPPGLARALIRRRNAAAARRRWHRGRDRLAPLLLRHLGLPLPLRPQRPRARVDGARAGADWDVTFVPFSLGQVHVGEGEPDSGTARSDDTGLLALQAGVVVRDQLPTASSTPTRRSSRSATTRAASSATRTRCAAVLDGARRRRRRRASPRSPRGSRSRPSARSTRPPPPSTTCGACPPSSPATQAAFVRLMDRPAATATEATRIDRAGRRPARRLARAQRVQAHLASPAERTGPAERPGPAGLGSSPMSSERRPGGASRPADVRRRGADVERREGPAPQRRRSATSRSSTAPRPRPPPRPGSTRAVVDGPPAAPAGRARARPAGAAGVARRPRLRPRLPPAPRGRCPRPGTSASCSTSRPARSCSPFDRTRPLWEFVVIDGLRAAGPPWSRRCTTPSPTARAASGCRSSSSTSTRDATEPDRRARPPPARADDASLARDHRRHARPQPPPAVLGIARRAARGRLAGCSRTPSRLVDARHRRPSSWPARPAAR